MTRQPDFSALRDSIFALHHQGEYAEALSLVERESPALRLTAQAATAVYWRACFLALLGRPDEALAALQKGLHDGYWWSEQQLRNDPDLAALQGRPPFEALIETCRSRAASSNAQPQRLIAAPHQAPLPYPLLLALHGYNGNAESTLPYWVPLTGRGWLVATLQSSQPAGMDGYHWMDEALARQEVEAHLAELSQAYPLDRTRLAIGGFSNGGRTALLLALTGAIPVRCAISVGGALRDESLADLDWTALESPPRLLLIAGELDTPVLNRMRQQAAIFADHGLDVALQVIPDLGHQVPADLIARLDAWLP